MIQHGTAIFSRTLGGGTGTFNFSPMMYTFTVDEKGRPLQEVASSWEMRTYPQIIDRSTAGREWFKPWLDDMVCREDGPARCFINQLTTPPDQESI